MQANGSRRRYWLRALLAFALVLLFSVTAGFIYLKSRLSPENIAGEATQLVRRRSGFELTVGSVRITWSGDAELKKICLRNPAQQSSRCLLSADIVSLDIRLLPLLKRQIEIQGAHIDSADINLFREEIRDAQGRRISVNSWDTPGKAETGQATSAAANEQGRIFLAKLQVTQGRLFHEVALLPLPMGTTTFSVDLSGRGRKLVLDAVLPGEGKIHAALRLQVANAIDSLRQLVARRSLVAGEQISGTIDLASVNLAALDARLRSISGNLNVSVADDKAELEADGARIDINNPYWSELTWSGKLGLSLPHELPVSGAGTLQAGGLAITYENLTANSPSGIAVDFHGALDLARLATKLGMLISGQLNLAGAYRNHQANVTWKASALAATIAHFPVSASGISGVATSDSLRMVHQQVVVAGNNAEISMNASFGRAGRKVSGSLKFTRLNLDAFLASRPQGGDAPQPGAAAAATAPGTNEYPALRLQVLADTISWQKLQGAALQATLVADAQAIRLEAARFVIGRGNVSLSYSRAMSGAQSLRLNAAGIKAQDLTSALGLKGTIYGDVQADVRVNFSGNTLAELVRTGSGQLSFRIGRGKIRDSFLQKGILGGPLYKLEQKFSDIEFASVSADMKLSPNKLAMQKVFFDAEEWTIQYRAESDSSWQGKAALAFRFRPAFVENVANPLHMGIADRLDGEFYDLPFACRGAIFSGACYQKNW